MYEDSQLNITKKKNISGRSKYEFKQQENGLTKKYSRHWNDSEQNIKKMKPNFLKFKIINKELEIEQLKFENESLYNQIKQKNMELIKKECDFEYNSALLNSEIDSLKSQLVEKEKLEAELSNQLSEANNIIKNNINFFNEIKDKQIRLNEKEQSLNSFKSQYFYLLSKIENKEYCIKCYKEELDNNSLTIKFLRENSLIKKLLNPISYLYLILQSNPNEILVNLKLYKILKNRQCFDIGFYLNNNKDIIGSKWCEYFSPELHYVCKGFNENRSFNKKYFNCDSKKELLDYICSYYK